MTAATGSTGPEPAPGATGPVGGDPGARPTPAGSLLLLGAALTVVPALAESPGTRWLLALVVGCALTAQGLWVALRRATPPVQQRLGATLAVTALLVFGLVMAVDGVARPESYLLVACALICALTATTRASWRLVLQATVVLIVVSTMALADRSVAEWALPALMLVSLAVLASWLADDLVASRGDELSARADAERRADLLDAVLDLPEQDLDAAAAATVTTLRSLGFDAAGVALVSETGRLEEVVLDGLPRHPGGVARGEGLAWAAIEDDRTVVTGDYQREARRLADRRQVGAAVVVPIRVDGEPVGAVMGARRSAAPPTAAAVEVCEVLAAHLGGAIDVQRRLVRQRELLERMGELDRMRTGLVSTVSSELRDPLTIVRSVGETLVTHGDDLGPAKRQILLGQLCGQADDLRLTINALLDFSRFQSQELGAAPQVVRLGQLLRPVVEATGVRVELDLTDEDPLVRLHQRPVQEALELALLSGQSLVETAPTTLLVGENGGTSLRIEVRREDGHQPTALVGSLVAQLVISGGGSVLDDGTAFLLPRATELRTAVP